MAPGLNPESQCVLKTPKISNYSLCPKAVQLQVVDLQIQQEPISFSLYCILRTNVFSKLTQTVSINVGQLYVACMLIDLARKTIRITKCFIQLSIFQIKLGP